MFKRILIANRGEIACRIIKTARRMGIETAAVYSEADKDALHVEMADTAVAIGPPAAAESYLVIDKIIAACKETGAEAVHPGYGFLSEREAFPKALAEAGIVFIGPNPLAIAAMGDKIESKKAAAAAPVATVPGPLGGIADEIVVRRRSRLHREVHHRSAPRRDPGARRQARQCHLSRRARMLDSAPQSEGHRRSPEPAARRQDA
jgi:acetyl/propionyl-CoA carboxylase alpha subunit